MALPFLVIQLRPETVTANNELAAIQRYGGLSNEETVRIRAEQNGLPNLALDKYAAIIVGGSPFDISTPPKEKSEIQLKVESDFYKLFDKIVTQDKPFLGCCSGNGLLGSYCGAPISDKYKEAVSGVDITLTAEGRADPLLQQSPSSFRVLVGHKEACDSLPPDCTLLASSDLCPIQMFRLHNNIYATQFHPEGDAEGFILRINIYKNHGYFAPETAQTLIDTIKQESTPEAQSILKRFVDRYRVR